MGKGAGNGYYAILRFEKHKNNPARPLKPIEDRKNSMPAIPTLTQAGANTTSIVKPEGRYYHFIQSRIEQAGCQTRRTFGCRYAGNCQPGFQGEIPKEIQAFFQRAADFLIGRVGRKISCRRWYTPDEKTPHLHLTFVPHGRDNRLCKGDYRQPGKP